MYVEQADYVEQIFKIIIFTLININTDTCYYISIFIHLLRPFQIHKFSGVA